MLRASTLLSSADHPPPLSSSSSFKTHALNIPRVALSPKSHQIPGLQIRRARSRSKPPRTVRLFCSIDASGTATGSTIPEPLAEGEINGWNRDAVEGGRLSLAVGSPSLPDFLQVNRMNMGDKAFFLFAFIACTTSVAFTSLVIAAVPTLYAMKRAAISLAKLADTAREELPSTMAAIRLSGMEISDLTLELSDLSQEIADGVSKSAEVVQAAEAGIRKIGALARRQTASMIEERANLPNISLQPVVSGAAKKTSRVVGQATKSFMNLISRGEYRLESEENFSDKVEY